MTDPLVRTNDIIAGKYRVERVLGEGGMGVVVAAQHLELDQLVAIKFLLPQIAEETSSAERFRREAKAAARIKSEHVCRVLDVGSLDSGVPYMVMEYLEGCDLSSEVSSRGRLPSSEAIDYVLQACEAVAEAHAAGIVHRDLKPENLFLARRADGTRAVKVLDFGVSKSLLMGAGQMKLTRTAAIVGSPLYMSPEQLDAAKDVDVRADIWALGTILYELMTGRTPFAGDSIAQLVAAVIGGTPPPFEALGVPIPLGLEWAVLHALEKDRSNRYGSVADFARGIAPFAPAHGALSVQRITRVLALTDVEPARSLSAVPDRQETPKDDRASTTMNVVDEAGAIRSETPQAWGHTTPPPNHRRRGLIAVAALFPVAVLLAFILRNRVPHDGTGVESKAAAVRPVLTPLPVVREAPAAAPPLAVSVPIVTPVAPSAPVTIESTPVEAPSHPALRPHVSATTSMVAPAPLKPASSLAPATAKPTLDDYAAFGGRK